MLLPLHVMVCVALNTVSGCSQYDNTVSYNHAVCFCLCAAIYKSVAPSFKDDDPPNAPSLGLAVLVHKALSKAEVDPSVYQGVASSGMTVFFGKQSPNEPFLDQDEIPTKGITFCKFVLQQRALMKPILRLSSDFLNGVHLMRFLPGEPETRRFQAVLTTACEKVFKHVGRNIRLHLLRAFQSSEHIEPNLPPPPPPSIALIHVHLPWLIREMEAFVVSLRLQANGCVLTKAQHAIVEADLDSCRVRLESEYLAQTIWVRMSLASSSSSNTNIITWGSHSVLQVTSS